MCHPPRRAVAVEGPEHEVRGSESYIDLRVYSQVEEDHGGSQDEIRYHQGAEPTCDVMPEIVAVFLAIVSNSIEDEEYWKHKSGQDCGQVVSWSRMYEDYCKKSCSLREINP